VLDLATVFRHSRLLLDGPNTRGIQPGRICLLQSISTILKFDARQEVAIRGVFPSPKAFDGSGH
jgi:hypothetical protein